MDKIDGQGGEGGTSGLLLSASYEAAYIGTAGSGHPDPIIPWVRDICLVETLYVSRFSVPLFETKKTIGPMQQKIKQHIFYIQQKQYALLSRLQQCLGLNWGAR